MSDVSLAPQTLEVSVEKVKRLVLAAMTSASLKRHALARRAHVSLYFVGSLMKGVPDVLSEAEGLLYADKDPRYAAVLSVLGLDGGSELMQAILEQHRTFCAAEKLSPRYMIREQFLQGIAPTALSSYQETFLVFFDQLWLVFWGGKPIRLRELCRFKRSIIASLDSEASLLREGATVLSRIVRESGALSPEDAEDFAAIVNVFR